jgi:hypothetical protein
MTGIFILLFTSVFLNPTFPSSAVERTQHGLASNLYRMSSPQTRKHWPWVSYSCSFSLQSTVHYQTMFSFGPHNRMAHAHSILAAATLLSAVPSRRAQETDVNSTFFSWFSHERRKLWEWLYSTGDLYEFYMQAYSLFLCLSPRVKYFWKSDSQTCFGC